MLKWASVASLSLCPLRFVLGGKGTLGNEGHVRLAALTSVAHLPGTVARSGAAEKKELRRAVCARRVRSVNYGADSTHTSCG